MGDLHQLLQGVADEVSVGDSYNSDKVTDYIDTGCPSLNLAIGRKGIPVGLLTTIVGLEASGKSTLGLHLLANTQAKGGIAVLIDSECRLWRERAERIGIDFDRLVQVRGATLERNLEVIEEIIMTVRKEDTDVPITIVYDSIAGSPTKADIDATYEDSIPARHARVLSVAMRRLCPLAARQQVTLVFINQLRTKISFGYSFGKPQMVMVGEHPLTYWSSLKIHLQQAQRLGESDSPTGILVNAEIVKNTIAPPFKRCQFVIDFKSGIDWVASAFDVALKVGLIEGNRGWYRVKGEDKPFRKDDFAQVLEQHPDLRQAIIDAPLRWTNGESHHETPSDD